MKIVCDSNMPLAEALFGRLGDVTLRDGRCITPDDLRDADALIIRSTTRVTPGLLEGSSVRFVGSGVIGTDHLDIPWLNGRGIAWCNAPGCNAESVADYFTAALLEIGHRLQTTWAGKTLGVVGVGNVGRRIVARGEALGMRVLCCDPPRRDAPEDEAAKDFLPLQDVIRDADALTLHTPLSAEGRHATRHLINAVALAGMKPDAVLLNMARGAVVETQALCEALETRRLAGAVIDCWEGEPDYSCRLARMAALTTPHVAGHAYEGKVNGTIAVYETFCRFLGNEPEAIPALPPPPISEMTCHAGTLPDEAVLRALARSVCDIAGDSARFQAGLSDDESLRRAAFDAQRKHYPLRRQFSATRAVLPDASPCLKAKACGIGFTV